MIGVSNIDHSKAKKEIAFLKRNVYSDRWEQEKFIGYCAQFFGTLILWRGDPELEKCEYEIKHVIPSGFWTDLIIKPWEYENA